MAGEMLTDEVFKLLIAELKVVMDYLFNKDFAQQQ